MTTTPAAAWRCFICDRPVRPGEAFTTVMVRLPPQLVRHGLDGLDAAPAPVHFACTILQIASVATDQVVDALGVDDARDDNGERAGDEMRDVIYRATKSFIDKVFER